MCMCVYNLKNSMAIWETKLLPMIFQWKWKVKALVTQLCLTLCDPMDCSPPGSSVYGILRARILEWVVIPFSRGFSWLRDQARVSVTAGRFFTVWAKREAQIEQRMMRVLLTVGLEKASPSFMTHAIAVWGEFGQISWRFWASKYPSAKGRVTELDGV